MVTPLHVAGRSAPRRSTPARALLALVAVVGLLAAAAPVQAHGEHGHSFGCPPAAGSDLVDPAVSAFEQVGAEAPEAATETYVGCSGDYAVKVTTAGTLAPGQSTVVFLTVANVQTGEILDVDGFLVEQSGAATSDGGTLRFLTAGVHGTDGLRAVTLRPSQEGAVDLLVSFPWGSPAGKVTVPVQAEPAGGTDNPVPGFELPLLLAAVGAATLILARRRDGGKRPPRGRNGDGASSLHRLLVLAVVAALVGVAGGAAAHAGEDHDETQGIYDLQPSSIPEGFTTSVSGTNVTFTSQVDAPVQLYDYGDFTTGQGPDTAHAYPTTGQYIVRLVAYDPATLRGRVYTESVEVGSGDELANNPPVGSVFASDRWVAFGDAVELDASGATEVDGDPLRYLWFSARADVGVTEPETASLIDVTAEPTLNWTAPAVEGDYTLSVTALDPRWGWGEGSIKVRVTETLPPTTNTSTFTGTLETPYDLAEAAGTPEDGEDTYTVDFPFPSDVVVTLTHDDDAGTADQGMPDVDVELICGDAISSNDEAGQETSFTREITSPVTCTLRVWLDKGHEVSYEATVEATYTLNPFL